MGEQTAAQRVRHALRWRARLVKRAYEDRFRPLAARRGIYRQLLDDAFAEGAKASVVFGVDDVRLDNAAIGDVLGFAMALAEAGHGVRVVEPGAPVPSSDVIIAASSRFDPSAGSPDALRIGWARTELHLWLRLPFLTAYDVLLAPSSIAADQLRPLMPRVEIMRPAADTDLFDGPAKSGRRRRVRSLPEQKGVARFREPWLYSHSDVVIDRADSDVQQSAAMSARFLEAAASGAVPLTNALVGAREAGFGDVPGWRDLQTLPDVIRALPVRRDVRELGRRLQRTVVAEHSWSTRAAWLADEVLARPERPGARRLVHVAPFYRGNPFQTILYSGLADIGAAAVPVSDVTAHLRSRVDAAQPGLLHLHWTTPILQSAASSAEARERLSAFTSALDDYCAAGGKLIWTLHNVLPHDVQHRDLELELTNAILRHAELVHVLSKETLDVVRGTYELDENRVVVIDHCSFVGVYPDWITREGARARLGLEPDAKAMIVIGGIRPYKGIDRMLDVLDELFAADPSVRLLIGGRPGEQQGVSELEERCASTPGVVARFEHLPDAELQAWFAAADVAVLPYVNILNSGAFMLAPSFGVPVVGPRMGALVADENQPYVRLFDPTSADDLRTVVGEALDEFVGAAEIRRAARQAAEQRSPAAMAAAFAQAIDGILPPSPS